jgi:hypothetical protein
MPVWELARIVELQVPAVELASMKAVATVKRLAVVAAG